MKEREKISFFCIVKNEEKQLGNMLESVASYVDEIVVIDTGSIDKTKEIAESYGAKIHDFEWIKDFPAARNFAMSKCKYDIVFWMDADDTLIGGENLEKITETLFDDPHVGGGFMIYQYAFDDNGHCALQHWKLRLFKKDEFVWKGRIHEDAIPKWENKRKRLKDIYIKHDKTVKEVGQATDRNLEILLLDYNENIEDPDPRTLFYLGNTYLGLHENEKAIEFYKRHFIKSGWGEERYVGVMCQADCHIRMKSFDEALDCYCQAIKLIPQWADAYFGMAQVYLSLRNYELVEEWTEDGYAKLKKHGVPDSQVLVNPRRYDLYPVLVLEDAYVQQGKFKEAIPLIDTILKFMPDHDEYKRRREFCQDSIQDGELITSARILKARLDEEGDKEKLQYLARALPETIQDLPSMARLRGFTKSKDRKEICIYCGPTHEAWSPLNIKTGLGGSEEAVVNIAQEFNKMGYLVTVYLSLPHRDMVGEYDGVIYKDFYDIYADLEKEWDVLILWRAPGLLKGNWKAKKTYLWLHDMQQQDFYCEEFFEKVDKIFVLSEYHKRNVSFIPDNKLFVTSNGIDVSHFIDRDIKRKPHKVFYGSSPDRGLDNFLSVWPEIRAAVPDAELHIYYGFTPIWESMYFDNPEMMSFKKDMIKVIGEMKKLGVVYHGRVGHQELADAMLESAIWGYPTCFPEISCITAMKAQAAGAIPVASNYAAIDETIKFGCKLGTPVNDPVMHKDEWRDKFRDTMIDLLKDENKQAQIRGEMMKWSHENFGWDKVAKNWHELFQESNELVEVES